MNRILSFICFATLAFGQTTDSNPRTLSAVTFANLGTPANGTIVYCSDCTAANPVAGSGSGTVARRENGAWNGGAASSGSSSPTLVGYSQIATSEGAGSSSYGTLTTPDTVSFTLSAGVSHLVIQFFGSVSVPSGNNCSTAPFLDNTQLGSDWGVISAQGGFLTDNHWSYVTTSVASGSHTVTVKMRNFSVGCTWTSRTVLVWSTP